MGTLCGTDCRECGFKTNCKGCEETFGSPFGGKCIAYEYIKIGGMEKFSEYKNNLIQEINELKIEGMKKVEKLYCLSGSFVNLEYPLPSGEKVKLLNDKNIYLGAQVENEFDEESRCFGVIAGTDFIIVSEYGKDGENPELVVFKRK